MTNGELVFVEAWNKMLKAAKEMEKEGNIKTSFGFQLSSDNNYMTERQQIGHALNGCFLENDYRLKE